MNILHNHNLYLQKVLDQLIGYFQRDEVGRVKGWCISKLQIVLTNKGHLYKMEDVNYVNLC